MMTRQSIKPYVSFVVDDSLNGRKLNSDPHAIIREDGFCNPSRLIGWQCGFEPVFVAVHSYLDRFVDDDEAIELATDFLSERNWFSGEPRQPDYVL